MSFVALLPVLPEIFLSCISMLLLVLGAFKPKLALNGIGWLAIFALLLVGILVLVGPDGRVETLGGLFIVDDYAVYSKILILLAAILGIIMSFHFAAHEAMTQFEYPILLLLAVLGMMMMVSANDLMALYLGIELQSLALYVIAAIKTDNLRASEAGLKYFVLGALSSGMLLYGMSIIYGFTGVTNFVDLADFIDQTATNVPMGLVVGLVFLISGLAFKISAVPFHMWTPDVYEGAPTPVTAFFAIAPKIAAMVLFGRVLFEPFAGMIDSWRQIIVFLAFASMLFGALAAIVQTNIKRLMAYSSISHMGFVLVGLAAGTIDGLAAMMLYMTIYLIMNVGTFCVILSMRQQGRMIENITDLSGLASYNPRMASLMAIFMFSLAGIPPLAGFFGKFFIFKAGLDAGLYELVVFGVLASVIGAYYYLRIVKLIYFDDPVDMLELPVPSTLAWPMFITGLATLVLVLFLPSLLEVTNVSAQALFDL